MTSRFTFSFSDDDIDADVDTDDNDVDKDMEIDTPEENKNKAADCQPELVPPRRHTLEEIVRIVIFSCLRMFFIFFYTRWVLVSIYIHHFYAKRGNSETVFFILFPYLNT